MSWSEEDFFAAFSDAGMLVDATRAGYPDPVKVGLSEPDALLLSDMVKITQYQIEYETAAMPDLKDDEQLTLGGQLYRVTGDAQKKGDGFYSIAELVKL